MNFLKKKILIVGITNIFSISWGIAKLMYKFGAELAFVYKRKKLKSRIENLAKKLNSTIVLQCNINSDFEIKNLSNKLQKYWKTFDGIVHSVAYTPLSQLKENYIHIANRQDFLDTQESCSFSLIALVKEFYPFLNENSSILTLSYLGSIKYVPCYNVIGPAKASLEANVRYLSYCVGKKNIRVNAISSGPIKTVSSYGIPYFKKIFSIYKNQSPLKKNTTVMEVGNVAAFLCSDLSSGITGQVIYVDSGFNISAMYLS
ncbi:NADH-dependent enoyl-ACP reductase [Buchnera aphidicola (Cinara tujafilina)]|uniref:Enoyl-[acyl-carrier-protein] reductase [NADH] n=1 Tax=Buchnera aphidicola (Cinara tujafilina) TaxID=261317 RepID=F7WZU1_9GAMM|nr:enoyl-ACP reductase [Buchnera aphidicola]AEH39757.1 NADH-dependent enoyl-ACP reductase [Buchnera aphidicola (Cinara tujafilina)]